MLKQAFTGATMEAAGSSHAPIGDLPVPKGHILGLSTEPQEVLDILGRKIPFVWKSQGRNKTDEAAMAYAFGEQKSGPVSCPVLLGLKTPTKVFCTRRTDVQAPDALLVFLASNGNLAYLAKNEERDVASGDVFVSRAQDLANFTLFPGAEWTRMVIPAGDVTAAMRALGIGDASSIPVFDAPVPRSLALAVHLAMQRIVSMANSAYSQRALDYAWRQMRESITLSLLVDLPHSMTDIVVRGQQRQASPRQMRRAIEFMEQFADRDISLGDIAVAAQCSSRTLSRLFREVTGTTPISFLRQLRLDKARAQIIDQPGLPLGAIAEHWGFCHSGQFALHYRKRFGESPSQTRRRH